MKNKSWFLGIGIAVCILLVGIICLVIHNIGESREEEADSVNQFTDIEKEELYYDYMEKKLASMIERTYKFLDCEVDIGYSESEVLGVDIKFTVSEGNIVNDSMRTDISEVISKALDISTENIAVSAN